jgi:hypothetical protein
MPANTGNNFDREVRFSTVFWGSDDPMPAGLVASTATLKI